MDRWANNEWYHLLTDVVTYGRITTPRGKETREILNSRAQISMTRPVVNAKERKLGYRFMCAEAAWIMDGDDRVATIAPFSKKISNFSDDRERFFGAYGPKFRGQLQYVIDSLRRDPNTRQAVINIWRENPPVTKDYPCTLSVQVMIRLGYLDAFVTMRSNDVWLGTPYDWFNASMLAAYILIELQEPEIKLGTLYHVAASRHLYANNFDDAARVLKNGSPEFNYEPLNLDEFNSGDELSKHLWTLARKEPIKHEWLKELNAR